MTATVPAETELIVPFVKAVAVDLGWVFVLLAYFVIVGTSNAVNLTDGLDGLAILPTVMVAGALAMFAYVAGNFNFAHYLGIPYVPGVGEVSVFCGAMVGAGLGFLWFNTYPAQVFMGDIGALSLGAALGVVAVVVRQEIVLLIMGGVFVMETVSVILQVTSYKLTGRRLFHMAPLHHHFELKGWPEPRVIVRFWIITVNTITKVVPELIAYGRLMRPVMGLGAVEDRIAQNLGIVGVIVICGAMVGAGLGFLWFNTYPAQVFMGDIGALSLGAALGVVAVVVRQEIVLLIMGGVFVMETVSVILQVTSYKLTGRRLFHMAPLHHHFELKGWPEPRVIVRFWIITVILVLIGLSSLKIR